MHYLNHLFVHSWWYRNYNISPTVTYAPNYHAHAIHNAIIPLCRNKGAWNQHSGKYFTTKFASRTCLAANILWKSFLSWDSLASCDTRSVLLTITFQSGVLNYWSYVISSTSICSWLSKMTCQWKSINSAGQQIMFSLKAQRIPSITNGNSLIQFGLLRWASRADFSWLLNYVARFYLDHAITPK